MWIKWFHEKRFHLLSSKLKLNENSILEFYLLNYFILNLQFKINLDSGQMKKKLYFLI